MRHVQIVEIPHLKESLAAANLTKCQSIQTFLKKTFVPVRVWHTACIYEVSCKKPKRLKRTNKRIITNKTYNYGKDNRNRSRYHK